VLVSSFLLLCLALAVHPASAQPAPAKPFDEHAVAEFYRCRTVRMVVGFTAGGGTLGVIARHLGKHILGPVVIENIPGAASIIAANHVYNVSPRDGTVIGNISGRSSQSSSSTSRACSSTWRSSASRRPGERDLPDDRHKAGVTRIGTS
jgi:tripartite-type tricarboxylate transporter receptor subunit TctC